MRTEVGASSYGSFVRKLSREQKYRVCGPSEGEGFVLGYPAVCNIFNCYLSFLVLDSLFPLLLHCRWTSCEVFCPFMTKPDIWRCSIWSNIVQKQWPGCGYDAWVDKTTGLNFRQSRASAKCPVCLWSERLSSTVTNFRTAAELSPKYCPQIVEWWAVCPTFDTSYLMLVGEIMKLAFVRSVDLIAKHLFKKKILSPCLLMCMDSCYSTD